MTKTKTILGLSLAAVFAVSMLGSAYAGNHLIFGANGITVENTGKSQSVEIEISVNVPSPTGADYGWAVDTSNGISNCVVISIGLFDSNHSINKSLEENSP